MASRIADKSPRQNVWQQFWNDPANRNNKLFTIKPGLGEWLPGLRSNRRKEIIFCPLRIGHSHSTHSYLLKGEEEPQCIPCNAPLTILVDCRYCTYKTKVISC